jgi:predicted DNA-binding protein
MKDERHTKASTLRVMMSIKVTPETAHALQAIAREEGRTVSAVVRRMVEAALRERKDRERDTDSP